MNDMRKETLAVAAEDERDLVARGIARWRRQRPDIDCSGKAVVGRILQMHGIIVKAFDEVLARHRLKYPVYGVLVTLRVEGPPYRLSPTQLGRVLLFTSGGLSNLLRRMERAGLIARHADEQDGRGVIVELTPKGLALAEAAMADHAAVERRLVAMLSGEEQKAVANALRRMILDAVSQRLGRERDWPARRTRPRLGGGAHNR